MRSTSRGCVTSACIGMLSAGGWAIFCATLRAAVPGKCIWGGVSAQMHIGEGTPETVRRAVRDAFSAFGNKGFILEAVPFIRAHRPWKNVLAMIDEWKRLRRG